MIVQDFFFVRTQKKKQKSDENEEENKTIEMSIQFGFVGCA